MNHNGDHVRHPPAKFGEETRHVARRMLDADIRHLPVMQGRMVVGVISMRDLLAIETWL